MVFENADIRVTDPEIAPPGMYHSRKSSCPLDPTVTYSTSDTPYRLRPIKNSLFLIFQTNFWRSSPHVLCKTRIQSCTQHKLLINNLKIISSACLVFSRCSVRSEVSFQRLFCFNQLRLDSSLYCRREPRRKNTDFLLQQSRTIWQSSHRNVTSSKSSISEIYTNQLPTGWGEKTSASGSASPGWSEICFKS